VTNFAKRQGRPQSAKREQWKIRKQKSRKPERDSQEISEPVTEDRGNIFEGVTEDKINVTEDKINVTEDNKNVTEDNKNVLQLEKRREEKRRGEERREEENPAATSAAVSAFFDATGRDCEGLYRDVTGQITIPSDQRPRALEDLGTILAHYQGDAVQAARVGTRVFRRWCNARGKTGKFYSRTNSGWLSWWLEEIAPAPPGAVDANIPAPSLLCGEGSRLKRVADSHKNDGSFPRMLQEYQLHLESCKTCGSGTTAQDVQAELRKLVKQWSLT